jgi:L-rhamnose mutarotase
MKRPAFAFFLGTVVLLVAIAYAKTDELHVHVERVGMVIGIKADQISAYEALHAASNAGVRDLLEKHHMHNFSIYLRQLDDGKYYLFGYYEYTGADYEADMAKLASEPRNVKWLSTTDPLQIPLKGEKSWAKMQEVYHNP